jgi:uncharacterized iron-regulated membrane protein
MKMKKTIGRIHLWLGLTAGVIVCFLGITGCILTFQVEIENLTQPYRSVQPKAQAYLPPSYFQKKASTVLPDKFAHNLTYLSGNKSAIVSFYKEGEDYYYLLFFNPYTGDLLKTKDMSKDFFRIILNGHFYLFMPPGIGQPIAATATLLFLILLITGLVLWWPRNKAARKQRFSIKWSAKFKRLNYDLHNVLGFYAFLVGICFAITGLVWGFVWFQKTYYWVSSGGKKLTEYYEAVSPSYDSLSSSDQVNYTQLDKIWLTLKKEYPDAAKFDIHFPSDTEEAIAVSANPSENTYWKADYRHYDQHNLQEIKVNHLYGRYSDASVADKLQRMNYDLHVGAVGGLPTKILAFFASFIIASLPITGFYIWWGRKKRTTSKSQTKTYTSQQPKEAVS